MCGIAGIVNIGFKETFQCDHIKKMADSIQHRGPDDEGYVLFSNDKTQIFFGDNSLDTISRSKNSNLNNEKNIKDEIELRSFSCPRA